MSSVLCPNVVTHCLDNKSDFLYYKTKSYCLFLTVTTLEDTIKCKFYMSQVKYYVLIYVVIRSHMTFKCVAEFCYDSTKMYLSFKTEIEWKTFIRHNIVIWRQWLVLIKYDKKKIVVGKIPRCGLNWCVWINSFQTVFDSLF